MLKRISLYLLITLILAFLISETPTYSNAEQPFRLAIHGGAGVILRENLSAEDEKAYHEKLSEALQAGHQVLKNGGKSLDAVETAIKILEDSPLFNAGKGAVFTSEGTIELDAAIMDGASLAAGSVAGTKHIKNPISLARMVMEKSPHVMMVGNGAEKFAQKQGMTLVDQKYFFTKRRFEQLQKEKAKESKKTSFLKTQLHDENKFGTVGAVALDKTGNLAAGTSTGGTTNKKFGRVGDAPIIGAGTYANNQTCAVSATGHGEYFIRAVVAYDISALMQYQKLSLKDASDKVVMDKLVKFGGAGGVICIDKDGNIAMPFNTPGMYRGSIDENGKITTSIFR
ncbi:MAG: isoaspartyl peptidase/L-asparaginase [Blastocatellia bacterium]|nr:isoaspartyl peptidase/L-asparaginase [Blastocatellia bacterium]MBL8193204.1 isoaspartyl peptidase/L-asparaginase [Blastocatellia bacterium]MBN8725907.1 isoaspartyl peptidase/L-asparaginase [Acidobacteriota bacterium]